MSKFFFFTSAYILSVSRLLCWRYQIYISSFITLITSVIYLVLFILQYHFFIYFYLSLHIHYIIIFVALSSYPFEFSDIYYSKLVSTLSGFLYFVCGSRTRPQVTRAENGAKYTCTFTLYFISIFLPQMKPSVQVAVVLVVVGVGVASAAPFPFSVVDSPQTRLFQSLSPTGTATCMWHWNIFFFLFLFFFNQKEKTSFPEA